MQHLIKLNIACTKFIGPALINDIEIAKYALSINGELLAYFGDEIQSNEDLAYIAAIENINALKYVSPTLINNFNFAKKIILQDAFAMHYFAANNQVINNIDIILRCLQESTLYFNYASRSIKENKNIYLDFILNRGVSYHILRCATKEMLHDSDFIAKLSVKYPDINKYVTSF